jgi:general secretion pathway protein A
VTALILDEAQNLSDETFEELRLLSNFETYSRKLLQIVLVGQPELQDRLRQPRLRQLRERVSVRAYVNPLSREQMMKYIAHRLERAGGDPERLFTPRALGVIVRRSGGIPRRANILCHNALLFAFGRNLDRVTHVEAREAVAEMDERRPGRLRRPALSRLRVDSGWGLGAVLGTVLIASVLAGRLWPSAPAPQDPTAPGSAIAAAPDVVTPAAAVAAVQRPEPVQAPLADDGDGLAAAPTARVSAPASDVMEASDVDRAPAAEPEGEPPDTMSIVVPEGASLWTLLRDIYGDRFTRADRSQLFRRVRELNPQVTDVHRIFVGDRLRLPVPPQADAVAGRAE